MKPWLIGYGASLVVLALLDGVWLGFVARDFYQREMAEVVAAPFRKLPAALFYFAYPIGVLWFALQPMPATLAAATGRAALVGLFAYGVYDLTNLATLKAWSPTLALVDVAWGTFLTAMVGAASYLAMQRFGS